MAAIVWFRRNLRIEDNRCLLEATKEFDEVIPVFVLEENFFKNQEIGSSRKVFLLESLEELKEEFNNRNNCFLIRRGNALSELKKVCEKTDSDELFFNKSYTPFGRKRDKKVMKETNLSCNIFKDHVLFEENEITNNEGKPYQIFSYYYKKWVKKDKALPKKLGDFRTPLIKDLSTEIPEFKNKDNYFVGGRRSGLRKLIDFREKISDYHRKSDFPGKNNTSELSPYLKFGNISIREAYHFFNEKNEGVKEWKKQLCWRDFYFQALFNWPYMKKRGFKEKYNEINWKNRNTEEWEKFISGKTGFPFIDAAIRQLKQTNWIHNRLRMVLCVFAAKDLFFDWKNIHAFFNENLVDADIPLMIGNIQWCYSIGPSSQPYFRVFNPIKQGKKYDSEGKYIKKHVPELSDLPKKFIHWPIEMEKEKQKDLDVVLGENYPYPIVDHKKRSKEIKEKYKELS